jgi:RimJ/RimL family protein N-acetyltransferase
MITSTLASGLEYKIALAKSQGALYRARALIAQYGDCSPSMYPRTESIFIISVKEGDLFNIVGTCSVGRGNNFSYEVYHVCIDEKFRQLGLATLLLEYAISKSPKPVLFANINAKNSASRRLFAKLGFDVFHSYSKIDRNGENSVFKVYCKLQEQTLQSEESF